MYNTATGKEVLSNMSSDDRLIGSSNLRSNQFFGQKEYFYLLLHTESNLASPKTLWNDLDVLMLKSNDTAEPSADDAAQAEVFFKFFITKIRENTAGGPETHFTANFGASFCTF